MPSRVPVRAMVAVLALACARCPTRHRGREDVDQAAQDGEYANARSLRCPAGCAGSQRRWCATAHGRGCWAAWRLSWSREECTPGRAGSAVLRALGVQPGIGQFLEAAHVKDGP